MAKSRGSATEPLLGASSVVARVNAAEPVHQPRRDAQVVPWGCPRCHGPLEETPGDGGLHCAACSVRFGLQDGIPNFTGTTGDVFYEARGEEYHFPKIVRKSYSLLSRLAMSFSDDDFSGNLAFLRHVMRSPGIVLDLGCGGGWDFYPARVGPTVGVDFALSSLQRARTVYPQVARAQVESLPFPDDTFDYVVSTDVLEHLRFETKDRAIAEISRVLRPGGRMVHICPVDSRHFLMKWAKKFPPLYRRAFIEQDGHDGFEPAKAVLGRLDRMGLRRKHLRVQRGVVWSKWEITKRFGNGYAEKSAWIRCLVSVCRLWERYKLLNHAVNIPLTMLDRAISPFFGLDHVYRIGVCYEKPR